MKFKTPRVAQFGLAVSLAIGVLVAGVALLVGWRVNTNHGSSWAFILLCTFTWVPSWIHCVTIRGQSSLRSLIALALLLGAVSSSAACVAWLASPVVVDDTLVTIRDRDYFLAEYRMPTKNAVLLESVVGPILVRERYRTPDSWEKLVEGKYVTLVASKNGGHAALVVDGLFIEFFTVDPEGVLTPETGYPEDLGNRDSWIRSRVAW